MCAERVCFHCHRMLVSDWLVAHGHTVLHIDGEKPPRPHRMTAEARVVKDQLIYSGDCSFSEDLVDWRGTQTCVGSCRSCLRWVC